MALSALCATLASVPHVERLRLPTQEGGSGAAASHVLLSALLTLCLFLFHLFSLFFQKRKSSSSVQLMVSVLRLPQCR